LKLEIPLKDIRLIRDLCIKNGVLNIAFSGGEPTLHSKFTQAVELFRKDFFRIHINTNGTFSDETAEYLQGLGKQIFLYFNVTTPGFIFNKTIRDRVLTHIKKLSDTLNVSVIITSKFQSTKEAMMIMDLFSEKLIKKVTVRLGVEGVTAGASNYNRLRDFPRIGKPFIQTFRYAAARGAKDVKIGKSITPCMFTEKDRRYLKRKGYLKTIHCHPEDEGLWFSINPALETYMCYPLLHLDRKRIVKNTNLRKLRDIYRKKQGEYEVSHALPECKKCPFYGLEEGKCPGPCAGFRINALTNPIKT